MPARRVRLTNPDRVLFPDDAITKSELFAYYDAVAPVLVPHLRDCRTVDDPLRLAFTCIEGGPECAAALPGSIFACSNRSVSRSIEKTTVHEHASIRLLTSSC
jgi:hypothetical protein